MKWSEHEIVSLKRHYPRTLNKRLARIFFRSRAAIELKAGKLGLVKDYSHLSKVRRAASQYRTLRSVPRVQG